MHGIVIGADGKAVNAMDSDARQFHKRTGIKEIVRVVTSSGTETSKVYVLLVKGNEPGNAKIMAMINLKSM